MTPDPIRGGIQSLQVFLDPAFAGVTALNIENFLKSTTLPPGPSAILFYRLIQKRDDSVDSSEHFGIYLRQIDAELLLGRKRQHGQIDRINALFK